MKCLHCEPPSVFESFGPKLQHRLVRERPPLGIYRAAVLPAWGRFKQSNYVRRNGTPRGELVSKPEHRAVVTTVVAVLAAG